MAHSPEPPVRWQRFAGFRWNSTATIRWNALRRVTGNRGNRQTRNRIRSGQSGPPPNERRTSWNCSNAPKPTLNKLHRTANQTVLGIAAIATSASSGRASSTCRRRAGGIMRPASALPERRGTPPVRAAGPGQGINRSYTGAERFQDARCLVLNRTGRTGATDSRANRRRKNQYQVGNWKNPLRY